MGDDPTTGASRVSSSGGVAVESSPSVSSYIAERLERADGGRFVGIRLRDDFDPGALLGDSATNNVVASYERPDRDFVLVAVGRAGSVELPVGGSPADIREGAAQLLGGATELDAAALRPRLLGGFAFGADRLPGGPWEGFSRGSLVLPRLLFVRDGSTVGVVVAPGCHAEEIASLIPQATAEPSTAGGRPLKVRRGVDQDRWIASVEAIAGEVRAGLYEKAVLASTVELSGDDTLAVGRALARLRRDYPHCHVFSFTTDGATFLGASPELLVGLHGGMVTALGLAGSARRGESDEEDEQLGRALLDSAKDRIEHETVVRAIREALSGATDGLRAPNRPQLWRLRNIQHLATEVSGRALPGIDVLELVQRLHPTPAVCGWPTDVAREVIAAHEDFDRGWYAGPIGWLDADGDGEFAVGLRSALVRGNRAWLFAGNGIMGDSNAAAELAEIELKFRPLADALSGAPD